MTKSYHSLKMNMVFSIIFIKLQELLKVSVRWMIRRYLLKFSFVRNFHNEIMCGVQSYSFMHKILSFFPLKNNSVTFLLDYKSAITSSNTINTFINIFFVGFLIFQVFINTIKYLWIINKCFWNF